MPNTQPVTTSAAPRVRFLVVGGSRDSSQPGDHGTSGFSHESIARQFGLPAATQDTATTTDQKQDAGASRSTLLDFVSRECNVESQDGPMNAILDISQPISPQDFFCCAGGPRACLEGVDVLFLVIHLHARLSFDVLAQLAVLEENTTLDEASLHHPRLVRVLLAIYREGELAQTTEVSDDQVRWLADMLTDGRHQMVPAGDVERTAQVVNDTAGEVLAARARDDDTTLAASAGLGGDVTSGDQPLSNQAAEDAQIGHKGLKNGEWVRRIFGR